MYGFIVTMSLLLVACASKKEQKTHQEIRQEILQMYPRMQTTRKRTLQFLTWRARTGFRTQK